MAPAEIGALEKELEKDDASASAWGRLGEARRRQGAWAEAYRCFVEARLLDENWADLHVWRARLLAELGRPREGAVGLSRARHLGAAKEELAAAAAGAPGVSAADAARRGLDEAVAREP